MTFTEQFIKYAEECTDSPRILLEWAAIWAISGVIDRKVFFEYGPGKLYANIWMILIGPSSIRKSTSMQLGRDLMRAVNKDVFYPQGWSKEALWQLLATNPVGMFFYDEAKSFFDCCASNYNMGVINDLTTMFGGESLTRSTKKENMSIIEPYIGFGGASTKEWMIDGIKDKSSAIMGGFLPRFLLIHANKSGGHYPWYRRGDYLKREQLIQKLQLIANCAGEARYDDPAMRAFEAWDLEQHAKIIKLETHAVPFVPFLNKMTTLYPHKLAMIAALDEGTFPTITYEAWQRAARWLSSAETSLHQLLGTLVETPFDKMRREAVKYLSKNLDCSREEFGDATHIRGKNATHILEGLQSDGKIIISKLENTTKPVTIIRWVGNPANIQFDES